MDQGPREADKDKRFLSYFLFVMLLGTVGDSRQWEDVLEEARQPRPRAPAGKRSTPTLVVHKLHGWHPFWQECVLKTLIV